MSQVFIQNAPTSGCGCGGTTQPPQTLRELVNAAPPEIRENLLEQEASYNSARGQAIQKILNHNPKVFTDSDLQKMKLHELKGIADMIPGRSPASAPVRRSSLFAGQPQPAIQNSAGLPVPSMGYENAPQLTANSAGLPLPTMNFSPAADVRSNASREGNRDSGRRPTANRMSGVSRQAETAAGLPLPSMDY